jgi:hypothetical protein
VQKVGVYLPSLLFEPFVNNLNVNWCLMGLESGSSDHGAAFTIAAGLGLYRINIDPEPIDSYCFFLIKISKVVQIGM